MTNDLNLHYDLIYDKDGWVQIYNYSDGVILSVTTDEDFVLDGEGFGLE